MASKTKTLMCKYFIEHKCFKGDECTYWHPPVMPDTTIVNYDEIDNTGKEIMYNTIVHLQKQLYIYKQYQSAGSTENWSLYTPQYAPQRYVPHEMCFDMSKGKGKGSKGKQFSNKGKP